MKPPPPNVTCTENTLGEYHFLVSSIVLTRESVIIGGKEGLETHGECLSLVPSYSTKTSILCRDRIISVISYTVVLAAEVQKDQHLTKELFVYKSVTNIGYY